METEVLESHNQEQGFWETTRLDYEEEETQKRRNLAFETLLLLSGKDAEEIRLTRLQAKSMFCSTLLRIRTVFIKTMQCAAIGIKRFIISGYSTLNNLYYAIIKSDLFTFCQLIYNKKRIAILS